jgi:hypothetical protein
MVSDQDLRPLFEKNQAMTDDLYAVTVSDPFYKNCVNLFMTRINSRIKFPIQKNVTWF